MLSLPACKEEIVAMPELDVATEGMTRPGSRRTDAGEKESTVFTVGSNASTNKTPWPPTPGPTPAALAVMETESSSVAGSADMHGAAGPRHAGVPRRVSSRRVMSMPHHELPEGYRLLQDGEGRGPPRCNTEGARPHRSEHSSLALMAVMAQLGYAPSDLWGSGAGGADAHGGMSTSMGVGSSLGGGGGSARGTTTLSTIASPSALPSSGAIPRVAFGEVGVAEGPSEGGGYAAATAAATAAPHRVERASTGNERSTAGYEHASTSNVRSSTGSEHTTGGSGPAGAGGRKGGGASHVEQGLPLIQEADGSQATRSMSIHTTGDHGVQSAAEVAETQLQGLNAASGAGGPVESRGLSYTSGGPNPFLSPAHMVGNHVGVLLPRLLLQLPACVNLQALHAAVSSSCSLPPHSTCPLSDYRQQAPVCQMLLVIQSCRAVNAPG